MVYVEICSGMVSGFTQTIIGHPFDTLKTLKQNKLSLNSIPIRSIFKGLVPSLIQCPPLVCTTFFCNSYCYKKTNNSIISGMCSGFMAGLIICPMEYLKVGQQVGQRVKQKKTGNYNDNRTIMSNMCKSYKTLHIVLMREVPALTIYFSSFRHMKNNKINTFIAGSTSGVLSWIITYPIDTIKTRVQSGMCKTFGEALQQGYLFTGINYCLMRAFIVNGISFSTYEHVYNYFTF